MGRLSNKIKELHCIVYYWEKLFIRRQALHFPGRGVTWWRHQMETFFPRYWPFVRGIHRSPVNSTQGQWRRAWMPFFWTASEWIKGWVNNREAGDLRRYRAHCDVTVMNAFMGDHISVDWWWKFARCRWLLVSTNYVHLPLKLTRRDLSRVSYSGFQENIFCIFNIPSPTIIKWPIICLLIQFIGNCGISNHTSKFLWCNLKNWYTGNISCDILIEVTIFNYSCSATFTSSSIRAAKEVLMLIASVTNVKYSCMLVKYYMGNRNIYIQYLFAHIVQSSKRCIQKISATNIVWQ